MPEELERDLFDELLKVSGDNIVAQPKKEWNDLAAESAKDENQQDSLETHTDPKQPIKNQE